MKRKFNFDASTVESLAQEAEEAALRQIEREQAEALKHKLPDFWLPSLTPTYTSSGPPTSLSDVKLQTTCRGGNPAHNLTCASFVSGGSDVANSQSSRKNLIPVKFIFDTSSSSVPSRSVESTPASESSQEGKKREEEQNPMCPSCKKGFSNSILMYCEYPDRTNCQYLITTV